MTLWNLQILNFMNFTIFFLGKQRIFFILCDLNITFISSPNWKLDYKWSMNKLSKERKNIGCPIMSQKDQQFKWKQNFDIPKFKFQNGLCNKQVYERQTPKNMCNYLCRFWIMWTMRGFGHLSWEVIKVKWWYKVFSHTFHAYILLNGKAS